MALADQVIRGSAWTMGGYLLAQALRLGSNLVLTRLLFPEAFGLMALVQVFMQGLQMFSDVGIGPSLIQNPRGAEPDFIHTAWTIQGIRGCVLALAACVLSWPMAAFYGQPELTALISASGLTALLAGFTSTAVYTAQRNLTLGRLTLMELISQAAGILLMIGLALRFHSVWVLVIGGIAGTLTRVVLSHTILGGPRHRLRLHRASARQLLTFGKWIFISTLTAFLAGQSDRLVFGKMIPLELLGVYGIAVMLATMPTQLIVKVGSSVVFPAYSRIVQSGRSLAAAMSQVRGTLMLGGGTLAALFIACGSPLVRVLYDERYQQAGVILQVLAVGAWFQILECTNGSALLALGKPRWVAAGNTVKLLVLVILIPAGYWYSGFDGALAGVVTADALKYGTAAAGATVHGLGAFRLDMLLTLGVALLTGVLYVVGSLWRGGGGGDGMVLLLSALLAAGVGTFPLLRVARARAILA